jgi:hypothetical protein
MDGINNNYCYLYYYVGTGMGMCWWRHNWRKLTILLVIQNAFDYGLDCTTAIQNCTWDVFSMAWPRVPTVTSRSIPTNLTCSLSRKMRVFLSPVMYDVSENYTHLSKTRLISPQRTCHAIGIFTCSFHQNCKRCRLSPGCNACTCCGRYGQRLFLCRHVCTIFLEGRIFLTVHVF